MVSLEIYFQMAE